MPAPKRGRGVGIVAASVAAHALLLAIVAIQAPRLKVPPPAKGPPEPVIPILIMPRSVPPPADRPGLKPAIRLHRRAQRFAPLPPVAPVVIPSIEKAERAPSSPPAAKAADQTDALAANAQKALRSRLGCDAPGLSRAEREACMDRFAADARDAAFLGLGIDRDKAGRLGSAAARREADYNYKRGITAPAPPPPGAGWDRDRGPPGQAEIMAGALKNDRPAAVAPF